MVRARRYVVSGRVQGVGFRFFARDLAAAEGLMGWVRNRADGTVEAVAEGDVEALTRFESKLRRGPALARVEHVDVDEELPSGRADGFLIRG